MKKILVNAYYAKNVGDDLFLKILFERYKNVKFYMLCSNNHYKEIFKEYKNVFIYNATIYTKILNKLTKGKYLYYKYDSIIYIGGSIFMQQHIGEYNSYSHRKDIIEKFNRLNKPVFIIGSNFGPYKDKKFKELHANLFEKCNDICFREKYSYNIFKSLSNVRVAPDVVFQLNYQNQIKRKKTIGISMIDLSFRKDLKDYSDKYYTKLSKLANKYISLDYKVKLFSFCKKENDEIAANKVLENIYDKNNVSIYKYDGNINEFLDEFSKMDTIIATRFHAMILGLVFEQNVFPIIYSQKTYNVLKDLGLEENCIHIKEIDNIDVDTIIELSKKNKLNDKNIIKESEKQFLKLDEYIY